ncbi:MAG: hypothetical protein ACLUIR_04345 [Faecalibacterium prausnitzii]
MAKIMEQNSLIRISSYCNGFRQVGNIIRPVTEMSDLAGLKIRTPSVASVVSFYEVRRTARHDRRPEVLNALQTGTVDGLTTRSSIIPTRAFWMSSPTSPNSTTATRRLLHRRLSLLGKASDEEDRLQGGCTGGF